MQISVKPKSETFTFKLRHFRNNVNGLGEKLLCLISSSLKYHWKVNSSAL